MSKAKHENKIITDAAQITNDYFSALSALGLPRSATPLEVSARIKKLLEDSLEYALVLDEILGDGRVSSADDFRGAISAVRLLRRRADRARAAIRALGTPYTIEDTRGIVITNGEYAALVDAAGDEMK